MIRIIDDLLLPKDIIKIHKNLQDSPGWRINRITDNDHQGLPFPGMQIRHEGQVTNPWLDGFFTGLYHTINSVHAKKFGFDLPYDIKRIHIGARSKESDAGFHCDEKLHNSHTIVMFLVPRWEKEWGGELNVEGELIECKPGRVVIIKTEQRHEGLRPKLTLPFWRISLNYVVHDDHR